jgi:hypothetical protein
MQHLREIFMCPDNCTVAFVKSTCQCGKERVSKGYMDQDMMNELIREQQLINLRKQNGITSNIHH